MTSLHLIEMPLDLPALHVWAEHRCLSAHGGLDEGRALHHLLGEAFGPGILQPFRLLVTPRSRNATIYAYAGQDSDGLREQAAATATPALADILDLARLRSLPRPADRWHAGQRLGFDLRLRPVIRLRDAIPGTKFGKGRELDAFLAEALQQHGGNTNSMEAAGRTREIVYLDWLKTRLDPVATLDRDNTRLASFRRTRVQRGGRWQEGPDVIVHGTLTIADPAAFADRLTRGVGRHRAYGYGMLLLRPPQRC